MGSPFMALWPKNGTLAQKFEQFLWQLAIRNSNFANGKYPQYPETWRYNFFVSIHAQFFPKGPPVVATNAGTTDIDDERSRDEF